MTRLLIAAPSAIVRAGLESLAEQEPAVAATAVVGGSGGRPRCEMGVHAATSEAVRREGSTAVRVRRIVSALGVWV